MTRRKDTHFDPADQRAAEFAKALAHPARITILRLLAERGTCICGEVVGDLPLSQSTVSQHLKALKDAGLIRGATDGPRSCYCLNLQVVDEAAAALTGILTTVRETAVGCACEPDGRTGHDAVPAPAGAAPAAAAAASQAPATAPAAPVLDMSVSSPAAEACGLDGYC